MRVCERLRKVAERIVREKPPRTFQAPAYVPTYGPDGLCCSLTWTGAVEYTTREWSDLESLWRSFPENFYDQQPTPSPDEIIAICERMEREEAEDRVFAEALKR
jgi:hypothetical protein